MVCVSGLAVLGSLIIRERQTLSTAKYHMMKRRIHTIGVHSIRMVRCGVRSAE